MAQDRFAKFTDFELDLLWESLSSFSAPDRDKVDLAIGALFREAARARKGRREAEELRKNPPDHGNKRAESGCDRCDCGCKYWEKDICIDCGTEHAPRHAYDEEAV